MSSLIKNFVRYAKTHRILSSSESRKIGIRDTLVGWTLIALSTVLFQHSINTIPVTLNFVIQFFSASIVLLIAAFFKGFDFLKIKEIKIENQDYFENPHLPAKDRKRLLFWRGLIATGGYMAYSWARTSIGIIDNSVIFSADAVIYALIMWFVLKQHISALQWSGLLIATLGISFVFFYDFSFSCCTKAFATAFAGIFSSSALAVIILINSVVVQHDPPLRIATYQCLIGFLLSLILVGLAFGLGIESINQKIPIAEILNAIFAGLFYAIALLFFFSAFLFTEPLLITVLGYSLIPFVLFFDWIIYQGVISRPDIISSLLIVIGGGIAIYSEYKHDKRVKTRHHLIAPAAYSQTLKEKMRALKEHYKKGKIDKYDYMSQRHEFNKLLFQFSEEVKESNIDKIEILHNSVIFSLLPDNIKIECDGGCRSAPFEILNFEEYEPEESELIFDLLKDGDIIFDVGAHIGWYSVNFSKKFPKSEIYSFEPIPHTFHFLQKNIKHNRTNNIKIFNLALLDQTGFEKFHYFKGGSAIASLANLIDHDNTQEIECKTDTLDAFCRKEQIDKLDFIKCDVEGSELKFFHGGEKSIERYQPIIFTELYEGWCEKFGYHPNDVLLFLENLGYSCFSVFKGIVHREKSIVSSDEKYNFFFLHNQKHADFIKNFNTD